jgi:hypothetical protein
MSPLTPETPRIGGGDPQPARHVLDDRGVDVA